MIPNIIVLEARIRKELFQLEKLEEELKAVGKIKDLKVESIRLRACAIH